MLLEEGEVWDAANNQPGQAHFSAPLGPAGATDGGWPCFHPGRNTGNPGDGYVEGPGKMLFFPLDPKRDATESVTWWRFESLSTCPSP
jgi:hypothetical protein